MHVSLLRRSATPTARMRRYSLQGPGARGMSLLETSSSESNYYASERAA